MLFSAPMVRAILAGRKTVTRRVAKPGRGQSWLADETLHQKVQRFEHRSNGWWSMQVGEPSRIVHCGVEMDGGHIGSLQSPYGGPGDRLWVKETWRPEPLHRADAVSVQYAADGALKFFDIDAVADGWKFPKASATGNVSPLFLPRWASRLTLEVVSVRPERLHEISAKDAKLEGCESCSPDDEFRALWESINGAGSWAKNPWVWRVQFKVVAK